MSKKITKLMRILFNPKKFFTRVIVKLDECKTMPDDVYLKIIYFLRMGKKLNLENPQKFNEKIQWIKLYDRNPLYTRLVDKYTVREYISNTIGEKYLIPLLWVGESFDDIPFDSLPEKFVIKCTHDSGSVVHRQGTGASALPTGRRQAVQRTG